jgi:hypothetical protein
MTADRPVSALTTDERQALIAELTEPERDEIRKALRYWLPVSYEGGVPYLCTAVERILAARLAERGNETTEVEWGVRFSDGSPVPKARNEHHAAEAATEHGGVVVRRERIRTPDRVTEWTEVPDERG